ncbi:hypothetical protein [Alicyclobacillus ferrooxydans]|nr:hypothetical protein [Alicyclobacillus ferrooxydans]
MTDVFFREVNHANLEDYDRAVRSFTWDSVNITFVGLKPEA